MFDFLDSPFFKNQAGPGTFPFGPAAMTNPAAIDFGGAGKKQQWAFAPLETGEAKLLGPNLSKLSPWW